MLDAIPAIIEVATVLTGAHQSHHIVYLCSRDPLRSHQPVSLIWPDLLKNVSC